MRTILKYPIHLTGDSAQYFMLPKGAKVVRFADQHQMLHLWVELEMVTPEVLERRAFIIIGTGHAIPTKAVHCASCEAGPFIWHLYEVPEAARESDWNEYYR